MSRGLWSDSSVVSVNDGVSGWAMGVYGELWMAVS